MNSKRFALLAGGLAITLALSGCNIFASASPVFDEATAACKVSMPQLKHAAKDAADATAHAEIDLASVSEDGRELFLNTTSAKDSVGISGVTRDCVFRQLGFDASVIATIDESLAEADKALKVALDNFAKQKRALAAAKKKVATLKKQISQIGKSNSSIRNLSATWKSEYNANPTCIEYDYDWETEEDIETAVRCSYDTWLYETKDWDVDTYGDINSYLSSSPDKKLEPANKEVARLQGLVDAGVTFKVGQLNSYMPTGFESYSIGWFYARKQALVLGLTLN